MRELRLYNSGWWIPHNAPMLEELDITCDAHGAGSVVSDTTPLPPNLKKLVLNFHLALNRRNNALLKRYLDRYANHTKLKELVISVDTVADTDNVLDAVLHLGQLERLKILFSRAWKSTQVQGFLDRLSEGCPNLSSLAITCDNVPSTQSINTLKRLEHLKELGFSIKGLDHDDGFWQAIKTFSQLKCIHVHPGKSINRHRRSSLRKQRPDLKIIVQTRFIPC